MLLYDEYPSYMQEHASNTGVDMELFEVPLWCHKSFNDKVITTYHVHIERYLMFIRCR